MQECSTRWMDGRRRGAGRVLRAAAGLVFLFGTTLGAVLAVDVVPAGAATLATWATGQYFDALHGIPFCDDVSVSNAASLPLTSITVGATPSGFTNYSIKNVNLAAGTAQVCGTDNNTANSSTSPPVLAPVATNGAGSATDNIPIGTYGACSWTTGHGTATQFDANQDLYQTGSQSAFGQPITNGETFGSTSNYANCTDAMVAELGSGESSGEGDAWTVNTANPLPSPTDTNPSAAQGDLSSSNLFLGSGGCYGAVNLFTNYSFTSFGSGTSLTTPSPWVNGGNCKYGSLGNNEAGGNTDSFATCPPTQADVNAGLVNCSITASSGNNFNGSFNYTTNDLFYSGQPVPQQSTASLSASTTTAGGTVSVTGGSNWWGSPDGAPNTGPYGDDQQGDMYQVSAPGVYIGTSRGTAVPVTNSTVAISANSYTCTGAESATVGPNPCVFTPGTPSGSFQIPAGLSPGTYNVYIDESDTTPLPGNGPNDAYQTARGTSLGTAESVSSIVVGAAPSISSGSAATFTVGSAGSFTVSSSGTPTAALSESGSLPAGVTFVDNGNGTATLAGTPASGSAGSYTITITAANGLAPNATQSFTLTVDAAPAITSAATTTFNVGSAGTFTVTSTGNPTASLSESGTLPAGVTFVDNGNGTATLAGTPGPATAGSYPFTIDATNGVGSDALQSFILVVDAAPAITSGSSTTFTVGSAGTFTVTSTGNPAAGLSESGTLPAGVTFVDNGNGTATLAGTPASGSAGSYTFTVTASNGVSPIATQSFTLTVDAAPAFTSTAGTTFAETAYSSFSVVATGNPTATLSETGSLPSGVTFVDNGNGTATLSGTPVIGTHGVYHLTLGASNGVTPNATQSFTLTVELTLEPPAITSGDSSTFEVGNAGSFTVTSTGTPTSGFAESGLLPAGVSFVDNGDGSASLAGTPAPGSNGTYPLSITASNGVGSPATQAFTLIVDAPPAITSGAATTFTVAHAGSFTVTSSGTPTAALTESGPLPAGVTFTDNGNGTATLAGTPAVGTHGTYTLSIGAANGVAPNATQSFALTVDARPAIKSAASTTFTEGTAGTFTVRAVGTPTPSLAATGPLPAGVTFTDNGNGTATLAGTPSVNGTFVLTVTASNGVSPNATQTFTLTVDGAPTITSGAATTFTEGTAGSFTVQGTGTPTPSLSESGGLPAGVTFTDNGNGTASLSGTPTAQGIYNLTVDATNGIGADALQSFILTVDGPPGITSGAATTFIEGTAGSFTVQGTGTPTPSLTESGALPAGVTFTDNGDGTGTLGGTATVNGTYHFTLSASNGIGSNATQSFTLTVDGAPTITSAGAKTFLQGSVGTFTVRATGTPTPSLAEAGALPTGVTFTDNGNATATLAGTPTTEGVYHLTITAANGVGSNAIQAFVLTVNAPPVITSTDAATFSNGAAGSFTVTSTGTPTPSLGESGTLPSGVSFTDNGNGTATLSGTTTEQGVYPVTLTAANGIGSDATQSFTLTVEAAPVITSVNLAKFVEGYTYSFVVTATGTPKPTISESGALPPGVIFHYGVLSGKATVTGTYPITFTASNGVGAPAVQPFALIVGTPPVFTSPAHATFVDGSPGTFTPVAVGTPVITFTEVGTLPTGVTFTSGVLSGTPTQVGTFKIALVADNGFGKSVVQNFTLTVSGLKVSTTSLPTVTEGVSYNASLKAIGGIAPFTWSAVGTLPKGIGLTKAGLLYGTVIRGSVSPGTYTITVKVTDSTSGTHQTATASLHLTIAS